MTEIPENREEIIEPPKVEEGFDVGKFDNLAAGIERLYNLSLKNIYNKEYELPADIRDKVADLLRENEDIFKQAILNGGIETAIDVLGRLSAIRNEADRANPYENEFSWRGRQIIMGLAPVFEEILKKDSKKTGLVLNAQFNVLRRGSVSERMRGASFLSNHLDYIEESFDASSFADTREYLKGVLEYGNEKDSFKACEIVLRNLEKCKSVDDFRRMVAILLCSRNSEIQSQGIEILSGELKKLGFSHEQAFVVLSDWVRSAKIEDIESTVVLNFESIEGLEEKEHGCPVLLHEEFGISDFARYPSSLLLEQYRKREDCDKPYGVIIFPKEDYNGAFYADGSRWALGDLDESAKGKFYLRVAECESKQDIARVFIKFNKKYNPKDGSGHKISLLILGGHGTEYSIRFGGDDARHTLQIEDFTGKGVKKTSKFFESNPTIILSSCSTGVEEGIGQELSKKLGAKVIAPKVPTNLHSINLKEKEGSFTFDVEYKSDEKGEYQQGVSVK